jgi:hypothetical protein
MRPEDESRLQPRDKALGNQLFLLSVLIVAVGVVGTLTWDLALQNEEVPGTEHNAVLGITIFIQAMIAFFGILNLDEPHTTKISPLTKGGMRAAIAGAMVVTYISLVIFHCMVEFATGQSLTRDSFVKSFTGIINSTIIFYFASEAAIHWINSMDRRRDAGQHEGNGSRAT